MASNVKDIDRGFGVVRSNMRNLDGEAVAIGIQGPDAAAVVHDSSDLSNVALASIHEFGAPLAGIPERSFVRSTFDAKNKTWTRLIASLAKKIYGATPQGPQRVLGLVGEKAKSDMQNTINRGIAPPLKQETIDRKGSSKPLIDTGQLKQSITWARRKL